MRGRSASALRKTIASRRLDFPTPFAPAMQVKGPKLTSRSIRFLNPEIFSRVSTLLQSTVIVCRTEDGSICPVTHDLDYANAGSYCFAGLLLGSRPAFA